MAFEVLRSAAADADLEVIFDFLVEAALAFGIDEASALDQAARRLRQIEDDMAGLGAAPHQGTLRQDLAAGLRSVTKNRAIFYFDVVEEAELVRILAVFFGGQDHQRHMLLRLLGRGTGARPEE